MRSPAPIIIFCYNRSDKTALVLEHLSKNNLAQNSDLFVFCDGPRNEKDLQEVQKTHAVIDKISGFRSVTIEKRELNRGLANSVIYGVNKVFTLYETAIVLEDDIITSPDFLNFTNEALEFYKNDQKIFSITGFNYPQNIFRTPKNFNDDVFFLKGRGCSWGWATWKDRWQQVDFAVKDYESFKSNDEKQKSFNLAGKNLTEMLRFQMAGKIDSWAIRVAYHLFKNDLYTVFPLKTLVKNIGLDGSGSHKDVNKKMVEFSFTNQNSKRILKKFGDVENNRLAELEYVNCANKKSEKFSKKTLLKLRYIIIGFLLSEILNLIFSQF